MPARSTHRLGSKDGWQRWLSTNKGQRCSANRDAICARSRPGWRSMTGRPELNASSWMFRQAAPRSWPTPRWTSETDSCWRWCPSIRRSSPAKWFGVGARPTAWSSWSEISALRSRHCGVTRTPASPAWCPGRRLRAPSWERANYPAVIANAAKQSSLSAWRKMDCFAALAMTKNAPDFAQTDVSSAVRPRPQQRLGARLSQLS